MDQSNSNENNIPLDETTVYNEQNLAELPQDQDPIEYDEEAVDERFVENEIFDDYQEEIEYAGEDLGFAPIFCKIDENDGECYVSEEKLPLPPLRKFTNKEIQTDRSMLRPRLVECPCKGQGRQKPPPECPCEGRGPKQPPEKPIEKCANDALNQLVQRLALDESTCESRPESTGTAVTTSKHTHPRMHECPSIESFLKLGEPVHIEFRVLPGPKLFAHAARLDGTILDVKKEISKIVQVPYKCLDIRKNNILVQDHRTLFELGARPRKKLKLSIEITRDCSTKYTLTIPQEPVVEQRAPIQRQILVPSNLRWKNLNLTIEFENEPKPYLGGFREKRGGKLYHNAQSQTHPTSEETLRFEKTRNKPKEDASSQTFNETSKQIQTLNDKYQQTERRDYYLSKSNEKIIQAKLYVSADFMERKRWQAAVIIQKYYRRWKAIRERESRMNALLRRVEWAENARKGRTENRLQIIQDELTRQHHPKTLRDIELLYRAINEWHIKEIQCIKNKYPKGRERQNALTKIAFIELDLLRDLEKTKMKIKKGLKDRVIEKEFQKMGEPFRTINASGGFISWDTSTKFTSRQYAKLYYSLKQPVTNLDVRYALLEVLYEQIRNHESTITKYLVNLIGRELALSELSLPMLLEGTRKRLATAFYRLCRDPTFNPEAKRLQNIPFEMTALRKDMVQCNNCHQMLSRDQFKIINGVTVSNICLKCSKRYSIEIMRDDLNLYRYMLDELRQDEQEAKAENSVTYLIDEYDIRFLVEQLWHGASALSGMDDRYLLRLCRWNKNVAWTPWNSVLLTEEEAVVHLKLDDITHAYQPTFFDTVNVTHEASRIYFARLTSLSIPLDSRMADFCEAEKRKKEKEKRIRK